MDSVDCDKARKNHSQRERTIVNCCWNCKNLTISTDTEHEDGGGIPYCLMDGVNIIPSNICADWEEYF